MMLQRPSGTVTFLFTDLEGSTRLWEQHPAAMPAAAARHDGLLRQAVEAQHGYVVKTTGDGLLAAFRQAHAALLAALHAQRLLLAETWGEIGALRARMGIHSGPAEERDGDYFGPALNRAARLMAVGHGGQVLLSQATHELVQDALPAGVTVRDLGQHRLKDLGRPEHVYQLVAPDLPTDFPPLKTLDARPNNLPVQRDPLLGREKEVATLRAMLLRPDVGVVTLTGPGGTGKTRLALQLAADLLDQFRDGVYFVDLAPITEPGLVPAAIAQALEVREQGNQPILDQLLDYLHDKQLLLVLDNFEQVVAATPQVARLLTRAPGLRMLVTSRIPLRLRGEQEFPVPPLGLPPLDASLDMRDATPASDYADRIMQYEAVRLFVERARAVQPDFSLQPANAPAVAAICHRLDGLPLAIELAAARIRLLPPQAMLTRLNQRLRLLTGGPRDLPDRQQTLRNAIAWSYDLLDETEQTLFRRLAVFAGGFTLEAAETVCSDDEGPGTRDQQDGSPRFGPPSSVLSPEEVLDGVDSLLTKSLVRRVEQADGEPRFTMLETIREYATEKLRADTEADAVHRAHARFFRLFAPEAAKKLVGPEQLEWLDQLEADHDNLRAALAWLIAHQAADEGLQLACSLAYFWEWRGYLSEGRRWLEAALANGHSVAALTPQHAQAYAEASLLAERQSDYVASKRLAETSLALSGITRNKASRALALRVLGMLSMRNGQYSTVLAQHEESLALYQEVGDRQGIGAGLTNLGETYMLMGDYARAGQLVEDALAVSVAAGDSRATAKTRLFLGLVLLLQGDFERAEQVGRAALDVLRLVGDKWWIAQALLGFAVIAAEQGQVRRAVRILGAAAAMLKALGSDLTGNALRLHDRVMALASAQVWTNIAPAWAEGQAMTPEQVVQYALAETPLGEPQGDG